MVKLTLVAILAILATAPALSTAAEPAPPGPGSAPAPTAKAPETLALDPAAAQARIAELEATVAQHEGTLKKAWGVLEQYKERLAYYETKMKIVNGVIHQSFFDSPRSEREVSQKWSAYLNKQLGEPVSAVSRYTKRNEVEHTVIGESRDDHSRMSEMAERGAPSGQMDDITGDQAYLERQRDQAVENIYNRVRRLNSDIK